MAASGTQKSIIVALGLITVIFALGAVALVANHRSQSIRAEAQGREQRLRMERARRSEFRKVGRISEEAMGRADFAAPLLVDRQAPEGGIDIAAHADELGEFLARRIVRDLSGRSGGMRAKNAMVLLIHDREDGVVEARAHAASSRAYDYTTRIAAQLERMGQPVTISMAGLARVRSGAAVRGFKISLEHRGELEFVHIERDFGTHVSTVCVDPRIELRSGHRWQEGRWYQYPPIRFATLPTIDAEASRGDALEGLGARIRNLIYETSLELNYVDDDLADEKAFKERLADRFGDAVLAGFGSTRMFPSEWDLEDDTFHQTIVSWEPNHGRIREVARLASKEHASRQNEPWIRGGLALGALVLAILGWLRVDWMLKGRFSWLTKIMFLVLLVASCVMIYNVDPFHV